MAQAEAEPYAIGLLYYKLYMMYKLIKPELTTVVLLFLSRQRQEMPQLCTAGLGPGGRRGLSVLPRWERPSSRLDGTDPRGIPAGKAQAGHRALTAVQGVSAEGKGGGRALWGVSVPSVYVTMRI